MDAYSDIFKKFLLYLIHFISIVPFYTYILYIGIYVRMYSFMLNNVYFSTHKTTAIYKIPDTFSWWTGCDTRPTRMHLAPCTFLTMSVYMYMYNIRTYTYNTYVYKGLLLYFLIYFVLLDFVSLRKTKLSFLVDYI